MLTCPQLLYHQNVLTEAGDYVSVPAIILILSAASKQTHGGDITMVRLDQLSEAEIKYHEELSCPTFETQPWVEGATLSQRRVAIVSTAGLHRRGDRPFTLDPGDYYRVIPRDIKANDLVMTHVG